MSRYYDAQITMLREDYDKLLAMAESPENTGLKQLLGMARHGVYTQQDNVVQDVLIFENFNWFVPEEDENVKQLYDFLEATGCAAIASIDEEGYTDYKIYDDNEEKAYHFDACILDYKKISPVIQFYSLAEGLKNAVREEITKCCYEDELKKLTPAQLKTIITEISDIIRKETKGKMLAASKIKDRSWSR